MLDARVGEEVLAAALAQGGDYAEIFLEDRSNNSLMMRDDITETVSAGRIHGAGVRVLMGNRSIYAYTNNTDRAGLLALAGQVAEAVRGAPGNIDIRLTPRETQAITAVRQYPGSTAHTARLKLLREANTAVRDVSPEITQAQARYIDSDQRVWIANSEGLFTQDRRIYTRMTVTAVASSGGEMQTGYEGPGAMAGIELFESIDIACVARRVAERAVRMLHAPVCPAGVMPVAMAGGFGGVVFHEACGHSLEATSVARGQSEFAGRLGQTIAAPCVTAIDDGTIPGAWGSLNIDDEGLVPGRLVLIEGGVLKNYMIDRLGAKRMGMAPTGSGRRESYRYAPTSRMRNTFIAAGDDDEAEIIASMGDGLYAVAMGGGSVDPATGGFNFAVEEGYLVKNGRIDSPVRGASLIGRGSEVLMKIDRVGRDVTHGQGMCGSLSGSIPTNVGQPTIRISSLTVGGRAS